MSASVSPRPLIMVLLGLVLALGGCPDPDDDDAGDDDTADDDTGDDDTADDDTGDDDTGDDDTTGVDADGDGYTDDVDCDDNDPDTYPGAEELCDGADNDCDGTVPADELDADGDGITGCGGDCNDNNATVYPGAEEVCNGAQDDDCDPSTDENVDDDQDGFTECEGDCDDTNPLALPGGAEVCDGVDNDCDPLTDEVVDDDADGYSECDGDCDDTNDAVSPVALEVCDGLDNDCDGSIPADEVDGDNDGSLLCEPDCDDTDPDTYPGAPEQCDGIDNDCDGTIDEDTGVDADGDGYNPCDGDCDDSDPTVNPGAAETCDGLDTDCDGTVPADELDADADGWMTCEGDCDDNDAALELDDADTDGDTTCDGDCNDFDADLNLADADADGVDTCGGDCDDGDGDNYPGNTEICDGGDNDCDGDVDDADADIPDADLDGAGACTDCDDADAANYPGNTEVCDGQDNDCDTLVDDADPDVDPASLGTWYADTDGDGFGDAAVSVDTCTAPTGYVADGTDCDDGDGANYPGNTEICDGQDNDCDALVDDADPDVDPATYSTWYADTDGDGFGDAAASVDACAAPTGYVADGTDCDDGDGANYPGNTEVCDGQDNDCDGDVDGADADIPDADGDGFDSCADCDDADAANYPGNTEVCDGQDNDCDGLIDDADPGVDPATFTTWYVDADGDGTGDPAGGTVDACAPPTGYVADGTDCDDADAANYPGNTEVCDGQDNDCDEDADDDDPDVDPSGFSTWYADTDFDGFGDPANTVDACGPPAGYVADDTDCDDGDGANYPGNTEICDGGDNDCDGDVDDADADIPDGDGDGAGACADCDDGDPANYPGNAEVCDGQDNDCDSLVDDADPGVDPAGFSPWYADGDGDGFGDPLVTVDACAPPSGYVGDNTDCDDGDGDNYPGNNEVCDGQDNDCDGLVDDADPGVDPASFSTWYADTDLDTYGDPFNTVDACDPPSGYVADDTDCDDTEPTVFPGNPEICDDLDNDCDGIVDNALLGSGASCPAASCLNVLEDGSPTGTGLYWIDPYGVPYEEWCDFGTVSNGWAFRVPFDIDNPTAGDLIDHQVYIQLDTQTLIGAGKLLSDGADLRFFTHDGPLLEYWIEGGIDTPTTGIWVIVPLLPANMVTPFTLTYDNPDTERKSFSWWFDPFDTDTSADYDTWAGFGGAFVWDPPGSEIRGNGSNADFFLEPVLGMVQYDVPIYVEIDGYGQDNDAIGPVLYDSAGGLVSSTVSNDYNGNNHTGGLEILCEWSGIPTGYYQGTVLLNLGNIANLNVYNRIGIYYDGINLEYYLGGVYQGSVPYTMDVDGGGLTSIAVSPVAHYDYLWIGSKPIWFHPEQVVSSASSSLGVEQPF